MNTLIIKLRHYGLAKFFRFAAAELKLRLIDRSVLGSYSQVREDLTLDALVKHKKYGFYVDIGAYDPFRFSNTMRFYKRGWAGINIEPNTDHWKRFLVHRKRDINLNIGIGKKRANLTFYSIDPPTLSTFSKTRANAYIRDGFKLLNAHRISVLPLKDVFVKYAKNRHIDFMSIDVEGYEMEVLASNDWKRFRPSYLCIETAVDNSDKGASAKYKLLIGKYLATIGYSLIDDNGLNSFYQATR